MGSPDEVRSALEEFISDLASLVDSHRLEDLLHGRGTMTEGELGSRPEPWTRKHLRRKLLRAVDLEWEPEIHGGGEGYPDFGITNLDVLVIGEDKSINKIEDAEEDIRKYLNNRAASRGAEYGIATDGIVWTIYRIELGGDYLDYDVIEPTPLDLRQALLQIARENGYISQSSAEPVDIDEFAETFYEVFSRDEMNKLLTEEAPVRIRQEKREGIEEFYDLYVELLFGEGSGDYSYDTTLIDEIRSPESASKTDIRKFAIKLVNRLLFIKFLEDRGVGDLSSDFLNQRVEKYEDASEEAERLGGGLYKTQIEPIFFKLFNTPKDDRFQKHSGDWFDQVPYLNGSLFAPEKREREYDVDDDMLTTVITDLVEGHKLSMNGNGDGTLDPSVLGNVFEMTINHLGSGEAQKDEGAYYTPSDVIRLITEKTVDPKVYEILVDVYSSRLVEASDIEEELARSLVSSYDLGEMLREIEQRSGYFRDPEALDTALNRLKELKVIDPACGSGHFLTGVLDEVHRIRMSLLRGKHGDDLEDNQVYKAKKELVLESIYGVDINPIGIEIAKLRVWLKMVEEGWEQDFEELPNIDINIVAGNSLIGLPARSEGQAMLAGFEINISGIENVRDMYKEGNITRMELDQRIEEMRPELNQHYLEQINHSFDHRLTDLETWNRITRDLDHLFPTIEKVTVRRSDEGELTAEQQNLLEDAGFYVEPRYEQSAKVEEEELDKVEDFGYFLEDDLVFEVVRQPVAFDLDMVSDLEDSEERAALSYKPFHWPVEFPEATVETQGGYEVEFDIVVGNPPYGDVLEEVEKRFTSGYKTGNINDIVAPFVERELQILEQGGYFGNILALLLAYQKYASELREIVDDNVENAEIACFTRRPQQVFEGSQARTGIITGRKASGDDQAVKTSRFIRFNEEEREEVFRNIGYESTEGLILGKKIGSGENYSLPKIGHSHVRSILEKLKESSDTVIRDKCSRKSSDETQYVVYRSRHPAYFINPCLENLYPENDVPDDFDPMYFESDLERYTAFLMLQSSLFYLYWMVYENERDVNWKSIDTFPFPDNDELEENEEDIEALAEILWDEMSSRWVGGSREMIRQAGALKPITDRIDDLIGPMFGLSDEEVEYVKNYDLEYRLSEVNQEQLFFVYQRMISEYYESKNIVSSLQ